VTDNVCCLVKIIQKDKRIFAAVQFEIKLFNFFYRSKRLTDYIYTNIYCKLSKCIGQTSCSYEHIVKNAKNVILRLSRSISSHFAQFTLKMCVAPEIAKNSLKTLILGLQGHLGSSTLKPIKKPLLLVMISSMSVPICNRFHATRY